MKTAAYDNNKGPRHFEGPPESLYLSFSRPLYLRAERRYPRL
jgi:hypothetical protein